MMLRLASLLVLTGLMLACDGSGGDASADGVDEVILLDGKGDDFFSVSANEYWVSGPVRIRLEESDRRLEGTAKDRRIDELVALNNLRVSWFLNVYLAAKEPDASNKAYGGFGAMARFYSGESAQLTIIDDSTIEYAFRVQVAGSPTLLTQIPGVDVLDGRQFDLKAGILDNAEMAQLDMGNEWYRRSPWADFDPASVGEGRVETIPLTIHRQAATLDSFLPYDRLFADGELTVGVHTGWDYHSRYDIWSARAVFQWLTQNGFTPPSDVTFEKYDPGQGPMTRTIVANGKSVVVKVWIFHPGDAANLVSGPSPDTAVGGLQLENAMRESFSKREVIMYLGHSGPLYGFALANWNKTYEGEIDDSEIPLLDMPADTFQLVLANGCDTYGLGQAFWRNPAKSDHKNLNVITTTSFANAGTGRSAIELLAALTTQVDGKFKASKLSEIVGAIDTAQGPNFRTLYGVHGSEANPRRHPFSDASYLCRSCRTNTDCGPEGNRCTKYGLLSWACSFECLDDTGCPEGYACRRIASLLSNTVLTRQCVAKSNSCDQP